MYRVAVCDDQQPLLEEFQAQCEEILTRLEVEHEIVPFTSAEALEAALNGGEHFDLLCLDIMLTGKSGMEFATELRRRDDQISIILASSSTNFLLDGYNVRPIRYLLKPIKPEDLEAALRTDLRLHHWPKTVTLKVGGKSTVLPLDEIRYVESRDHGCMFYMDKGDQFFWTNLTKVEQLLPPGQFCRCHNSFLVNLAKIQEAGSKEVVLNDGSRLTIGRRYADQFQRQFVRYLNSDPT